MRCYSEREIQTIVARKPQLVTDNERPTLEHEDSFDAVQFIADLEFKTKFEALLRSISLRLPRM